MEEEFSRAEKAGFPSPAEKGEAERYRIDRVTGKIEAGVVLFAYGKEMGVSV